MVRPFQGFMAEDGSVYDTEAECEAYEAAYDLHRFVRQHELVEKLDETTQNYIITEVVKFISTNKAIVARYIEAGSNPTTIQFQPDLFEHGRDNIKNLGQREEFDAANRLRETTADNPSREQD